jgi:hypothetical protein
MSAIDGHVDDREKEFIFNIGKANGLTEYDIEKIMSQSFNIIVPKDLTPDQRFDYLLNLILLMKVDKRLFQEEINYCAKIATRLGYKKELIVDLMIRVTDTMTASDIEELRIVASRHLAG